MKNNKLRLLVIVIVGLLIICGLSCIVLITNNSRKFIVHRIDNTNINISLNNKYKHINDNKCDFHYSNKNIDLYIKSYDTLDKYDYSSGYLIAYDEHLIQESVKDYKVIDQYDSKLNELVINTKIVSGINDGNDMIYHISTVNFSNDDRYILNIIQISSKKYDDKNSIVFRDNINTIRVK